MDSLKSRKPQICVLVEIYHNEEAAKAFILQLSDVGYIGIAAPAVPNRKRQRPGGLVICIDAIVAFT